MTSPSEEIKGKIDRVASDGQVTREEFSELRQSIACLAPEVASDIRAYIETKTQIHDTARAELRQLFVECLPDGMPHSERVFYGTRSEMFSPANRRDLADIVSKTLNLAQYPFITPERRENILLAVTDRFIHDSEFQGMVNLGINFAQMANTFVRSFISDKKTESDATATVEPAKTRAASLEEQIARIVARSLEPIKKGFENKKITAATATILDDPRSLAKYDGGDIVSSASAISPQDLESYLQGLNGEIRAIDKKILPLETIREEGLNALAQMPEWIRGLFVDMIKWIMEAFPFLGNIIARMAGYRDADDLGRGLEEELRQRRALGVLRQFGRVRDVNGKESDGAHKGKIKLLEDRDLSGVNRKKLGDFFAFTQETGVKTDTTEFWTGIFNDGKIVAKDAEGKDEIYEIGKIEEGDLEKDYKGLYEKLNAFKDIPENRKWEREQEDLKRKTEADRAAQSTPSPQPRTPAVPQQPIDPKHQIRTASTASENAVAVPVSKSPEALRAERAEVLRKAFMSATAIPFQAGSEEVRFAEGSLWIGSDRYALNGKWFFGLISSPITNIAFDRGNVILHRGAEHSKVLRSEIAKGIAPMLALGVGQPPVIARGQSGELEIARIA